MSRVADMVRGSNCQNPFSDSQARNFSDSKLINEFCPISNYWSLFNDQHEVLLGTRGSGKTFLLVPAVLVSAVCIYFSAENKKSIAEV